MKSTMFLSAAAFALMAFPSFAQETPAAEADAGAASAIQTVTAGAINLELNTAVDLEGNACRLVYVVENKTPADIDNASYEVAVFNDRNVVSKMLLLEFGQLNAEKTRVVQFDLPDTSCGGVSKILVNNQVDCTTTDGPSTICMSNLATRALDTAITFTH